MPTYDYVCANGHRFEVIHGVHDAGPTSCPVCHSADIRKAFAPPTIHYKGSGWAKKDRGSSGRKSSSTTDTSSDGEKPAAASSASSASTSSSTTGGSASTSESSKPSKGGGSSGGSGSGSGESS